MLLEQFIELPGRSNKQRQGADRERRQGRCMSMHPLKPARYRGIKFWSAGMTIDALRTPWEHACGFVSAELSRARHVLTCSIGT